MLESSIINQKGFLDIKERLTYKIIDEWEKALKDPYPSSDSF